jgi:hypothetical protein
MIPEAWISLAVPGRLMRSLVAEGPETSYGVRAPDGTAKTSKALDHEDVDAA